MKTLQYYSEDGNLTVFHDHTIDEHGVVVNTNTGNVMTRCKNGEYNRVAVSREKTLRGLYVARALASTFLGPPPTLLYTPDHEDGDSFNDTLNNIRWLDKSGQSKNRNMPPVFNTAFIITKDGVEHTAKGWLDIYKKPNGNKYITGTILKYAREKQYGFSYKTFPNLRGEVWKSIPWSRDNKGEWLISNKSRMKYKTNHAENVLSVEQLHKDNGYPDVQINGKGWKCHKLSMMVFRPREYAAKLPGDIILHKDDDKLDFNPFQLRWGTPPENSIDAHKNGKYDGTTKAQKPVASYINGVFEKEHESISDAARYLKTEYDTSNPQNVSDALKYNVSRYGRTWKFL
ncbi:hypothetical protein ATCVNEJV2_307R [Acanthocystis turfacea Chlorella virus NE-JV-2]|nr:hypothetical protein ATCVNEJV2_307R [Acanthocystis turfacea Chlorella virus NE-JV-2]